MTTHVHAEYSSNERSDANSHSENGDLQIQRKERIPIRVEDELHNLLRRLDVSLGSKIRTCDNNG